jgi:CheY-like chemotaxis protein
MDALVLSPPRVLVLEGERALQFLLLFVLREAGYAMSSAFTLEAAWAALEHETFALILADVPVGGTHPGSFMPAHQLRRRAQPTPVGLLMTHPVTAEEARQAGFAFVLPMPFDLDDLVALVAATLQTPLGPTHERYASLVERFLSALERDDQSALLSSCSEEVTWYRLTSSLGTTARRIQGKHAFATYVATRAASRLQQTILNLQCYALPRGLVACYTEVWVTPEGYWRREATTALFHFDGDQIAQIGVRPHLGSGHEQAHTG